MLQQQLLYIIAICSSIHSIYANCRVERVTMREPIEHDIGLIFDLTVSNRDTVNPQMLQFTVNSNGVCTLNLTNGEQVKAGTLFGGDFATIAPGYSATVSLVLPTESVYNRVGSCPIVITSINRQNEMVDNQKKLLHFDTRFETLDPNKQSLRRREDYVDCNNWDKNYLDNCTPLDCEERYFGLLSYYNQETEHCEEQTSATTSTTSATTSVETTTVINEVKTKTIKKQRTKQQPKQSTFPSIETTTVINEVKPKTIIKEERTKQQKKQRTLSYNIWELHPYGGLRRNHNQHHEIIIHSAGKAKKEQTKPIQLHLQDAQIQTTAPRNPKKKASLASELKNFYFTWYNVAPAAKYYWSEAGNMSLRSVIRNNDEEHIGGPVWEELNESQTEEKTDKPTSGARRLLQQLALYSGKEWLLMAMEALLLIFLVIIFQIIITCVIYVVVCLGLFGVLELIVGMAANKTTTLHLGKTLTPRHKKNPQDLTTSASLMSVFK